MLQVELQDIYLNTFNLLTKNLLTSRQACFCIETSNPYFNILTCPVYTFPGFLQSKKNGSANNHFSSSTSRAAAGSITLCDQHMITRSRKLLEQAPASSFSGDIQNTDTRQRQHSRFVIFQSAAE